MCKIVSYMNMIKVLWEIGKTSAESAIWIRLLLPPADALLILPPAEALSDHGHLKLFSSSVDMRNLLELQ